MKRSLHCVYFDLSSVSAIYLQLSHAVIICATSTLTNNYLNILFLALGNLNDNKIEKKEILEIFFRYVLITY